jgi:hypothetical protein
MRVHVLGSSVKFCSIVHGALPLNILREVGETVQLKVDLAGMD